jgi:diguanylate cyclase (GGDEF)-like protein
VHLYIFVFFTFLTGLAWSWIYFATLPYTNNLKQLVILLVFGGMSTGSTSSLGTYIPAFIAYISAIFVPVIIYYFSFLDVNKATIASIFMLFLFAITFIAKNFQGLLQNIFYLTEQNENLIRQLEELSITDPLTNLYNKRYFAKVISTEYNRSKRNKYPLAFVSFDVDNFKLINDNFGHTFGDKFLIYVAYYFKTYLRRSNDILFRLGGDEFTALLINATEEEVKYIAEQIQTQFLKNPSFDYQPQDDLHQNIFAHVTLSIGIVYIPYESTCSIETVIEEADKLLYQAKHEGKNQIKYSKI